VDERWVGGSARPFAWPASVRQPARPRNKPLPLPRGERDEPHPTALSRREQPRGWGNNVLGDGGRPCQTRAAGELLIRQPEIPSPTASVAGTARI